VYETRGDYVKTYCPQGVHDGSGLLFASTVGYGVFLMNLIMMSVGINDGVYDLIEHLMDVHPDCFVLGASYPTLCAHNSFLMSRVVGQEHFSKSTMNKYRTGKYNCPEETYDATGFLSGSCHKREHPVNTLIRELYEETGLVLTDGARNALEEDIECGVIENVGSVDEEKYRTITTVYKCMIDIKYLEFSNTRPKPFNIRYRGEIKKRKVVFAVYGSQGHIKQMLEMLASVYSTCTWKPTDDINAIVGFPIATALEFCHFAEKHSYLRNGTYHKDWCLECYERL
jgi:hypothetical protein